MCSIALSYDVHRILVTDIAKDKGDHAWAIHKSIHGTEQMILRGSESVEFMEELWKLTWNEDVLKVIQKQDDGRQVGRGGTSLIHRLFSICIPWIRAIFV